MRASDGDRDRTTRRLRHAASEGRLRVDELEQRLEATFAARTYGELEVLVVDLPAPRGVDRQGGLAELLSLRPQVALAAVLLVLVLIAVAAGVGFRRSSAAAARQPRVPANTQVNPGEQGKPR